MKLFFNQIALFYKSLADENRLRIIMNLAEDQKSVSQIIDVTKLSQPLVSHHLKELKNNLVVKTERKGSFVYYELNEPALINLIRLTNQLLLELNEKSSLKVNTENKFYLTFPVMMKKMFELMNQSKEE